MKGLAAAWRTGAAGGDASRRNALCAAALVLAACASSGVLTACGPAASPKTISMRMRGAPANASVTIDEQFVGTLDAVGRRGVALPPGVHRVSVEAPGHFPWDKLVEAKAGQGPMALEVRLVPIPD